MNKETEIKKQLDKALKSGTYYIFISRKVKKEMKHIAYYEAGVTEIMKALEQSLILFQNQIRKNYSKYFKMSTIWVEHKKIKKMLLKVFKGILKEKPPL